MRQSSTRISDLTIEDIFDMGLHEFLVEFMRGNSAIANAISEDYRFLS